MRVLIVLAGAFLFLAACGGSGEPATPTPIPAPSISPEDAEAMRQLSSAYWKAYNEKDVDLVLSFLEHDYGLERESKIVRDLGRRAFIVVEVEATEENPPRLTAPDEGEMFLQIKGLEIQPAALRESAPPDRVRMGFVRLAGEWKISFAEKVE